MSVSLAGISSMATRQVLGELATAWQQDSGHQVAIESVGGVDAARRVAAGEAFDVVFLASDALDKLEAAGHVVTGSRVDLVLSSVAVAVPAGAPRPDLSTEEGLKQAVLAAPSIGYSTGPSGTALMALFERWGVTQQVKPKLVQARPGVPVGSLIAKGEAALGLQQLSELMNLPGVDIVGPMPPTAAIDTIFSGAVCATSSQAATVRELLAYLASPATAETKRRHGMAPA